MVFVSRCSPAIFDRPGPCLSCVPCGCCHPCAPTASSLHLRRGNDMVSCVWFNHGPEVMGFMLCNNCNETFFQPARCSETCWHHQDHHSRLAGFGGTTPASPGFGTTVPLLQVAILKSNNYVTLPRRTAASSSCEHASRDRPKDVCVALLPLNPKP